MKKILLGFTVLVVILFSSCSSNDDSASSETTSNIYVDDSKFISIKNSYSHHHIQMEDGDAFLTTFTFLNSKNEILELRLIFQDDQNVSGNYSFISNDGEGSIYAGGAYKVGSKTFVFRNGSMIVTELGDGKFKFVLDKLIGYYHIGNMTYSKKATGIFEGTFQLEQ